jgi:hypothetical protein
MDSNQCKLQNDQFFEAIKKLMAEHKVGIVVVTAEFKVSGVICDCCGEEKHAIATKIFEEKGQHNVTMTTIAEMAKHMFNNKIDTNGHN